jgi:hypothetical protein
MSNHRTTLHIGRLAAGVRRGAAVDGTCVTAYAGCADASDQGVAAIEALQPFLDTGPASPNAATRAGW